MSAYTLFLSAVVNSYDENTEPFYARYLATFDQQQHYSCSTSRVKTYALDATETATIGSFSGTTDWRMLLIKVVGEITFASAGTDAASAAITGLTGCYGTTIFPGWIVWSTANITSAFTIRAITDDTTVEVFFATLAADA